MGEAEAKSYKKMEGNLQRQLRMVMIGNFTKFFLHKASGKQTMYDNTK